MAVSVSVVVATAAAVSMAVIRAVVLSVERVGGVRRRSKSAWGVVSGEW